MLREINQPLTAYATFYEEDGEEGETGEHPVVNVYRNNVQIVANCLPLRIILLVTISFIFMWIMMLRKRICG
jgi:hypothetical protein